MHPCADNVDGAAVAVEGRIGYELVMDTGVQPWGHGAVVVGFKKALPSIIQTAVPGENAQSACHQVFLVVS